MAFEDAEAATRTLEALSADRAILAAQIVRSDGTHRMSNDDRSKNANLLHEPRSVITHRLKGVVTHPLAAAMPARVRRKYSEALPKRGRDVPPAPA